MSTDELWAFLPVGYLLTVAIEVPVLVVGLSKRHAVCDRLLAGLWLTAGTYPIVVVVLPTLMWSWYSPAAYLWVAETFAPAAECGLFWLGFIRGKPSSLGATCRDFAAIVVANLASFAFGERFFNA